MSSAPTDSPRSGEQLVHAVRPAAVGSRIDRTLTLKGAGPPAPCERSAELLPSLIDCTRRPIRLLDTDIVIRNSLGTAK